MAARDFLRTCVWSRSLSAAIRLHTSKRRYATVRLPGFAGAFRFRTGTEDAAMLRTLLWHGGFKEYRLPEGFQPRTILDVGANIGSVSAHFARRFPSAAIYSFEPLPENYELLVHNTAACPNITTLAYGLGARTENAVYAYSPDAGNKGGGGFCARSLQSRDTLTLPVVRTDEALAQLKLDQIDLIKIDVEGAEYEILTSIAPAILSKVRYIVGELHLRRDEELLEHLSQWFAIKRVYRRGVLNYFHAANRETEFAAALT